MPIECYPFVTVLYFFRYILRFFICPYSFSCPQGRTEKLA